MKVEDAQGYRVIKHRWYVGVLVIYSGIALLIAKWTEQTTWHGVAVFAVPVSIFFVLSGLAIYYGVPAIRDGQYPPPGSWVLGNEKIFKGRGARRRGWLAIVAAVSFLILGLLFMRVGYYTFE